MNTLSTSENSLNETELALKALSQSACGAIVAETDGNIIYANQRFCDITGYAIEELIGKNPRILQSGNTRRETYLTLWNTISSGRPWHGILQNRRKNGELYWESITITPLKSSTGEITHFSAILDDITQAKADEDAQAELNEEIFQEEKRESLAAMAVGMAHILNNSLTCILGACDIAEREQLDSTKVLEMIELIADAAKKSAAFIREVTDLWKPTLPTSLTIELTKVLSQHLPHYQRIAGDVTLSTSSDATESNEIPVLTIGSPALIHQAMLALIANAREASSDGPIELRCGTVAKLAPSTDEFFIPCGLSGLSVSYIEVKDAGAGMDSYLMRRAFNPFFSTKSGRKGLGLAMVSGVMNAHKGAIGVISSPGKGTRVRLYFRGMNTGR